MTDLLFKVPEDYAGPRLEDDLEIATEATVLEVRRWFAMEKK